MPAQDKITFKFISSGDSASFRVVRYGHPDHDRRIEIRHHIYPLYSYGRKRYNYTIGEYMRQVVAVRDYLHWEHGASEELPEEYARAFEAWSKANYEEGIQRAKRDGWYEPEFYPEYTPTIKGTARFVFDRDDPSKSHWQKTRMAF